MFLGRHARGTLKRGSHLALALRQRHPQLYAVHSAAIRRRGSFRVGDTLSSSHPTKYLGVIQHVHHWVGEGDDGELIHRTLLYVCDAVA